jgi:hypothetical protein
MLCTDFCTEGCRKTIQKEIIMNYVEDMRIAVRSCGADWNFAVVFIFMGFIAYLATWELMLFMAVPWSCFCAYMQLKANDHNFKLVASAFMMGLLFPFAGFYVALCRGFK